MYTCRRLSFCLLFAIHVLRCSLSAAEMLLPTMPETFGTSDDKNDGKLPCSDLVEGCEESQTNVDLPVDRQDQVNIPCDSPEGGCNELNDLGMLSEFTNQDMRSQEFHNEMLDVGLDNNSSDIDKHAAQQAQNLLCYDIQCNGEACISVSVIQAGTSVTKCTALDEQVCYVEERQTSAGISLTAGCGGPCDTSTRDKEESVSVWPTTETTTWMAPGSILIPSKRKKRSSIESDIKRRDCCDQFLCNHDSPCGSLTCKADFPSFAKVLSFLVFSTTFHL